MEYRAQEVIQYAREEKVKFVRLAFSDVYGRQKNVTIMASELERAFDSGIAFDASAVPGFGGEVRSDLFLHPDPATLAEQPWRPENGRLVRMFCDIRCPDGSPFEADCRHILRRAVRDAEAAGCSFAFGSELEFYLFRLDENGEPTRIPYDRAGYMDIAPEDRGENIRREICLTLEQMGIRPESSHHEEGPSQNEIDFRYSEPLSAADNSLTFLSVVRSVAAANGLCADFSPKPLPEHPGSGLHINLSVRGGAEGAEPLNYVIAGILEHIGALTLFLNPCEDSYLRLGGRKAPRYISWSSENRSQLIRIPAAQGEFRRAELRSADPTANPYLAFALLIRAGLDGIERRLTLPEPADFNLYTAPPEVLSRYKRLPASLAEAAAAAQASPEVARWLPEPVLRACLGR
ncbi:MAG TPA: glutamine synthetase [Candidatus Scatomorpha merdavium]|nr:glutamine synthetase [Candidatus Scatomorpha merdavium]